MAPQNYTGFKIWNLEFQAMSRSDNNVLYENGKLTNSQTGAVYWTEDDAGLKRHLYEFLEPMISSSVNGCGWSIDDELYSRLYIIAQGNASEFAEFRSRNDNIYDPQNNTAGEKTVKLVPTEYTRAMFFKHTSGYRAMIGLSLYAMDASNYIREFKDYSTNKSKIDPGFVGNRIYASNPDSSNSYYKCIGGLFVSMIPPANGTTTPSGTFHPEYNIFDASFLDSTASPVCPMIHSHYYGSNSSSSKTYYNGCSWLKKGSSTAYNDDNSGVVDGTNMKLSLMLDSIGNIGLAYKYSYSSNTKYLNPVIFIGPMYKTKFSVSDNMSTKNISIILKNIGGNTNAYTGYNNSAWKSYSTSGNSGYYDNRFYNSNTYYNVLGSITEDASGYRTNNVYTAYPALSAEVFANYRYAKAGYTTIGLIDEDIIRWSASTGLVAGQTYNNSEWCFLGNEYVVWAEDGYGNSSSALYPSIRWDGAANGTKTFT